MSGEKKVNCKHKPRKTVDFITLSWYKFLVEANWLIQHLVRSSYEILHINHTLNCVFLMSSSTHRISDMNFIINKTRIFWKMGKSSILSSKANSIKPAHCH